MEKCDAPAIRATRGIINSFIKTFFMRSCCMISVLCIPDYSERLGPMKCPRVLLAVFLGVCGACSSQPGPIIGTTGGSLDDNLSLLKLFDTPSEDTIHFYTVAYNILASNPRASFFELSRYPEFAAFCRDHGITLTGGPMLGSRTADGVKIWVRTSAPAEVSVKVTTPDKERMFGPVTTDAASDLTGIIDVTGLPPDSRCPYSVLVNGTPAKISPHAEIITLPESDAAKPVRIAFGSCYHRWGLANPVLAGRIRERNPAALLLMGDIAVQDRKNHLGLHRADYLLRDLHPAWRDLVAAVPVYAAWDDHDYFSNDEAGIPAGFTADDRWGVRQVFTQSWNNPAYGFSDDRGGIFFHTQIGPCDVIMTDNRYFRTGKKGVFLGEDQMQWLEARLLECRGPFIILSCGTMWSDYVSNGKDSWGRMDPEGRERLFRFIEQHRIGGVLLISGDRHGARGFRIPRPGGFSFYEFGAASLGARNGPPVTDPSWETQLYGFESVYAFGEFTIDATPEDPTVTFRLIREDGAELYTKTLTRGELTPPGT